MASFVEGTIPFPYQGETFQTYYKVFGDIHNAVHTPLIVLHGGPGFIHNYLIPIADLSKSANIPVILYDQIGNGCSTHLPDKPIEFWRVELFIEELSNLLKFFSIQDSFNLLGHSWGGILASEFAVQKKPEGLKKMILSNSLAAFSLWQLSLSQLLEHFPEDVREGIKMGYNDRKRYMEAFAKFGAVHACTVQPMPELLKVSLEAALGPNGDPTIGKSGFIRNWTIVDRVSQISAPTLLLNGYADMAQDFVMEPFFKGIPRVKWITFMSSSHTPFWEERERYLKVVEIFVKA